MREYSVFDILGPIMVGPSSSHTAGAARLALLARSVAGGTPKEVNILLHGSFAETYQGHGSDLALLGGLLGLAPDDIAIKDAYSLAKEADLKYTFTPINLGEKFHPNTVKFVIITQEGEKLTVTGASIGGGNVLITEINDFSVEIKGDLPTLISNHYDVPGVIAKVSLILAQHEINIAFMRVFRKEKRKIATMVLETDEVVPKLVLEEIMKIDQVVNVRFVKPI